LDGYRGAARAPPERRRLSNDVDRAVVEGYMGPWAICLRTPGAGPRVISAEPLKSRKPRVPALPSVPRAEIPP